jgi:hypothetical protein
MDQNSTNIIAYCGFVVSTAVAVLGAVNHKRCRSNCLGKDMTVSIDVENTTPPERIQCAETKKDTLVIKVPVEK